MEALKERYSNLTLLEENLVGQIYLGEPLEHSNQLVSIQTLDPEKISSEQQKPLLSYIQECQKIRHESLSPIIEIVSKPTAAYYVRSLPQGELLSQIKEKWNEEKVLFLGIDLLRGVAALHAKDLTFGPLDPSSIFIRTPKKSRTKTSNALGSGVLIQQGYRHFFQDLSKSWYAYEPPEGKTKYLTDGRADIYRIGVLLLELFSKNPVLDPLKTIEQLRCSAPLKNILQKMVAPKFLERYSNAIRMLKELEAYLQGKVTFEIGETQEKPFLLGQFVGRTEEWNQLKKFSSPKSSSKLIVVSGVAGIGKNRLITEYLSHLKQQEGRIVLESQCKPYRGIYGPFQDFLTELEIHPQFTKSKSQISKFKNLFTKKSRSTSEKEYNGLHTIPEETLKFQNELGTVLLSCATNKKVVFYFKNLQDADYETFELIRYLLRNNPVEKPILLIASLTQEEEGPLRHFLAELEEEKRLASIPLYGLDTPEASRLIATLLGMNEAPISFARKINESAEGSPIFITHLLHWMIETKILFLKESFWEADVDELDLLELPEQFKAIFEDRYSQLPPLAKQILSFLALHQKPLTTEQLIALTQKSYENCFKSILKLQKSLFISYTCPQGIPLYTLNEPFLKELIEEITPSEENQKKLEILLEQATELEETLGYLIQKQDKTALSKTYEFAKYQQKIHLSLSHITLFQRVMQSQKLQTSIDSLEIMEWICKVWNRWGIILTEHKPLLTLIQQQVLSNPEPCTAHLYLAIAESLVLAKEEDSPLKFIQLATKKGARLQDILLVEIKYHLQQENYEEAIKLGENLLSKSDQNEVLVYFLLGQANKKLAAVEKLAYEDSQDNFEAMIQAGEKTQDTYSQVLGYFELAKDALPNRPLDAKEALEAAFEVSSTPPPTLSSKLNLLFGLSLNLLGQLEEALTFYQKGTKEAIKYGLVSSAIEGYVLLAGTHRERGEITQAKNALNLAESLLTSSYEAEKYLIDLEKARLNLELYNMELALDQLEEMGDFRFIGMVHDHSFLHYLELGRAFLLLGSTTKALKQLNKAAALLNPTKDWLYMACAFMYIGAVHIEAQDSKKAMVALSKAESLGRLLNHPFIECWLNYLHGLNSVLKDNSFLAKKFFSKAEKITKKYANKNLQWRILSARGKLYLKEGQLLEARQHLEKAKEICQQIYQPLTKEEQKLFAKISSFGSLHKALKNLEQQNTSLSGSTSPKRVFEEIKNRLSQTEDDSTNLEVQNERLRVLLNINEKLNATFNNDTLPLIVETGINLTQAKRGYLVLLKGEEKIFRVALDNKSKAIKNPQAELTTSLIDSALKKSFLVDEKQQKILITLHKAKKPIGVLSFEWPAEAPKCSPEDITLLQALASQAAIALENIELYQNLEKKKDELAESLKEVEKINKELHSVHEHLSDKVQAQSIEIQEIRDQLAKKQNQLEFKYNYDNIIGQSPKIKEIFKILDKVIDSKVPIFIHGESGTGKELVAKAVHFNGERKKKNFCAENCAALSDSLLESELFGYVKGSFTGAGADRKGLFEQADQGTLFLDEVGDMSTEMQKKLLRVLQEGEIRRVGGKKIIPVNVRIISATHRDLRNLVSEGQFREDLYYRLNVIQVKLPPLRERLEDIPLLVQHFLKILQEENPGALQVKGISSSALELLQSYSWPGNIRELQNTLMSAVSLAESEVLNDTDFHEKISRKTSQENRAQSYDELFAQELTMDEYLQKFVESSQEQYNDTQLAKVLGITRKTLWQKRKSWGLNKP